MEFGLVFHHQVRDGIESRGTRRDSIKISGLARSDTSLARVRETGIYSSSIQKKRRLAALNGTRAALVSPTRPGVPLCSTMRPRVISLRSPRMDSRYNRRGHRRKMSLGQVG